MKRHLISLLLIKGMNWHLNLFPTEGMPRLAFDLYLSIAKQHGFTYVRWPTPVGELHTMSLSLYKGAGDDWIIPMIEEAQSHGFRFVPENDVLGVNAFERLPLLKEVVVPTAWTARSDVEKWIELGLPAVAGMDPDRAVVRNAEGFNASDGVEGHRLAKLLGRGRALEAEEWDKALRLALKYRRQIVAVGLPLPAEIKKRLDDRKLADRERRKKKQDDTVAKAVAWVNE
jgi:hypothetical protein